MSAGHVRSTRLDTHVLIVGGGSLGCATAYYLSCHNADVLLVERGALNREAPGATRIPG